MIELLAITDAPAPPPPDRCARSRRGGLAVVVRAGTARPQLDADALWRHEAAASRQLMADRDVLPVRYGTRFADEEAAARAVAGRGARARRARCDRVRGAVELSVRALAAGDEPDERSPGRVPAARGRRERSGRARCTSRSPRSRATACAATAASCCGPPTSSIAARSTASSRVVRELQASTRSSQLLCTGPWPPYCFAEARA